MLTTFNTRPATAADVRAEFRGNADLMALLNDDAQVTVREGARGRLHPDAIALFNADRRPSERYNERQPKTISITYKHTQPSGRKVNKTVFVPETEARVAAGESAGERGPLSKVAKAAVAEVLASA